jgi:hypothetical protein
MPPSALLWAFLALWWAVVSASTNAASHQHEDEHGQQTPRQCTTRLVLPTRSLSVLENSLVDLIGARVVSGTSDEDEAVWGSVAPSYTEAVVSLTIKSERGRLELSPGFQDMLPGDWYDGPAPALHLEGLQGGVNSALFGLRYLSPLDAEVEEDSITFSARVLDYVGGEDAELCKRVEASALASIAVRVKQRPYEPRLLLNERKIGQSIGIDGVLLPFTL